MAAVCTATLTIDTVLAICYLPRLCRDMKGSGPRFLVVIIGPTMILISSMPATISLIVLVDRNRVNRISSKPLNPEPFFASGLQRLNQDRNKRHTRSPQL